MTVYVDSSAYLKLFIEEVDSDSARALLEQQPDWVAARHTAVEVRRILARHFQGPALAEAREVFKEVWGRTSVHELDQPTCEVAASIAEETGVRTLDALHLAAAQLAGGIDITIVTYDRRMAAAARRLGMVVLGA